MNRRQSRNRKFAKAFVAILSIYPLIHALDFVNKIRPISFQFRPGIIWFIVSLLLWILLFLVCCIVYSAALCILNEITHLLLGVWSREGFGSVKEMFERWEFPIAVAVAEVFYVFVYIMVIIFDI